jgi:hypothetical protein
MLIVNYADFSHNGWLAVTALFVWLVPHVSIQITELRLGLAKSHQWEDEKLSQGYKAITAHSSLSLTLCLGIIAGTAAGIHTSTEGLDIEMIYVLSGLSKIFSAIVLFLLSIHIPTWFSIYYTERMATNVGTTLKALRFHVWWSMLRYNFMIYFFLLPFFCNENNPVFIPLSIIFGIVIGFLIFLGVYFGRTRFNEHKNLIAVVIVIILIVLSSFLFSYGCNYISTVWKKHDWKGTVAISFISWLVVTSAFHVLFRIWSEKKHQSRRRKKLEGHRVFSSFFRTAVFHPKNLFGSFPGHVATETKIATDKGWFPKVEIPGPNKTDTEYNEGRLNEEEKLSEPSEEEENEMMRKCRTEQLLAENENDRMSDEKVVRVKEEGSDVKKEQKIAMMKAEGDVELAEIGSKVQGYLADEEETYWHLIHSECTCGLCSCCCGHREKDKLTQFQTLDKIFIVMRWTIWVIAALCCLYITVINIAGMYQFNIASKKLASVHEILYKNMNDGKVCAFNETGEKGLGPLFVKTFENAEAAHLSNYTIAHCGACGACSNSPNLGLQYTTRANLAEVSQVCVKKATFKGYEAGLQCFIDTIGFDIPCSNCWLTCGYCARDNCMFLYQQQAITNRLTNFEVASGMKNAATCEEAMCELNFVPCSGANRRRMNIHSDIERPSNEMCKLVNEQMWATLF